MPRPAKSTLILAGVGAWLLLLGCEPAPANPATRQPAASLAVGRVTSDRDANGTQFIADLTNLANTFNQNAVPGIELAVIDSPTPQSSVVAAIIDNDLFEPRVLARENGKLSAARALRRHGVDALVGSGFVSEFQSAAPLGLLAVGGQVVSELSIHGYTRILGTQQGRLVVIGRSSYRPGMMDSALQLGPGIVEGGRLDISERELRLTPYIRAFVALCGQRTLAGVTHAPRHLYHLGQQILAFAREHQLECTEVVNMSGDREAILAVRSATGSGYLHFGDPTSRKAALIGFAPISPQK